jgi:type VI secretion system secreted protein Hcp
MSVNAFFSFEQDAKGESIQEPYKEWIEIQGFNWEVTNETSFTKGSGAAVGKAMPGVASFSHYYDSTSATIMNYLTRGVHFPLTKLRLLKATGNAAKPNEPYFFANFTNAYITKATIEAGEDGSVTQSVEFVFKKIEVMYLKQNSATGKLEDGGSYSWDIPKMEVGTAKLAAV